MLKIKDIYKIPRANRTATTRVAPHGISVIVEADKLFPTSKVCFQKCQAFIQLTTRNFFKAAVPTHLPMCRRKTAQMLSFIGLQRQARSKKSNAFLLQRNSNKAGHNTQPSIFNAGTLALCSAPIFPISPLQSPMHIMRF